MKTAITWGTVFGVLQAAISIVVSVYASSPSVATLACAGLLLSFALTVACGLIGAIRGKAFKIGFWAGMIATGFDVMASVVGYVINPSLLNADVTITVVSFVFSIGFGVGLSAVGAGIGILVHNKVMYPVEIKP